jgi:hypothetical protein
MIKRLSSTEPTSSSSSSREGAAGDEDMESREDGSEDSNQEGDADYDYYQDSREERTRKQSMPNMLRRAVRTVIPVKRLVQVYERVLAALPPQHKVRQAFYCNTIRAKFSSMNLLPTPFRTCMTCTRFRT